MPRGGKRDGAGKPRSEFHLSKEDWQRMRVLKQHFRGVWNMPDLTEDQILSYLIQGAFHEYVSEQHVIPEPEAED